VIAIDKPLAQATPLYPGSFVTATLQGKQLDDLWQLPATAVSQNSDVWYVSAQQTLAKFPATKVFSQGKSTYIAPQAGVKTVDIVVRPLTSYSQGMQVNMIRTSLNGVKSAELYYLKVAADIKPNGNRG